MKKIWIALAALALLALPAAAAAKHGHGDVKNAARYCKSLRTDLGAVAFRDAYGGKQNAFGKCVKQRVHDLRDARRAARKSCQDELNTGQSSLRRHGKPENRAALRQCVQDKLQAETGDDAAGVTNAAKLCATEREADQAAFELKYGTNENHRNAFGKCVSQHSDDGNTGDGNTGDAPQTEPGGDAPPQA